MNKKTMYVYRKYVEFYHSYLKETSTQSSQLHMHKTKKLPFDILTLFQVHLFV